MKTLIYIHVFLLGLLCSALGQRALPKYNVDRTRMSTSGISSGACMATQMHVAYSSLLMGVGMVAGTPYYCAKGSALTATGTCSSNPSGINVADLVQKTNQYASSGDIDSTSNLSNDRVFIFAGNQDSVVVPGVADKVQQYYQNYMSSSNIKVVKMNAQHTFPTTNHGNACSYLGSPYIGRCSYDGAYEILNHIYPGLTRPSGSVTLSGDFYTFDQMEFFYTSHPSASSMDTMGYVYAPSGCMLNQNRCRLHVVFHGCEMGRTKIGDEFARYGGYNAVGELNNIIMLYPQAIVTGANPLGCWDWWGYTVNFYATKGANQPLAVSRMIDRIS